jgi:hypothetical protein
VMIGDLPSRRTSDEQGCCYYNMGFSKPSRRPCRRAEIATRMEPAPHAVVSSYVDERTHGLVVKKDRRAVCLRALGVSPNMSTSRYCDHATRTRGRLAD